MDRDSLQSHQVCLNHCNFPPRNKGGGNELEQQRQLNKDTLYNKEMSTGIQFSNLVVLKSSDDKFFFVALLDSQSVVNRIDHIKSFTSINLHFNYIVKPECKSFLLILSKK